jgi:type II secretory pathway component GspD/PulD (secretin)
MLIALNRVVADLLESKSEVLVEVKIYQVARTKTLNLGVQPPQSVALFNVPSEVNNIIQQNQSLVQQIISSGLASAGDYSAIAALLIASGQVTNSILNQPFALFGGGLTESGVSLPGLTANLSLNSTDTRALDQIQLRLANNQDGTIRAGTRYPIETSSYSNLGATSANIPGLTTAGLSSTLAGLGVNLGSLSTAETIPQVQYQDLGMTLKVTPRIERGGDVALKLDLSLTALQGTSLNGLPVLTNQSYSADAVVQNGASALLVGDMSSELSKAIAGLPGLTDLPGFQSTTDTQTEHDVSSLVILITPHLLRQRKNEQVGPYIPLPLNSGN